MARCSFCDKPVVRGTGVMYVRKSGKILWFCSMKCEKNMLKLKRKSTRVKWITKKQKSEKKE